MGLLFLFVGVQGLDILSSVILPFPANDTAERVVPITIEPGKYQFEVWGAQGGKGAENGAVTDKAVGGKGAYATIYVEFLQKRTIYCYFGQQGGQADPGSYAQGRGAFNGGGKGGYYTSSWANTAGGGAGGTDCRLYKGDIKDEKVANSRFIVAGGGSGGGGNCPGAPGGGFYSFKRQQKVTGVYEKYECKYDTKQPWYGSDGSTNNQGYRHPFSGAGGGFYGGYAAINTDESPSAISGSGSSWGIGCSYPDPTSTAKFEPDEEDKNVIRPFAKCSVRNGDETFPSSKEFGKTETGHEGNGAVRISQLLIGNSHCTNGEVKVIRRKNHGVFFSLVSFLGN